MRMFTEVGRRAKPHTTAVGKAMLAAQSDAEVLDLLKRTGMARRTEHTITEPRRFLADLRRVRERGYAIDDGEQELGVRCVAVRVPDAPRAMALSMSGPLTRMTDEVVATAAPILHEAAADLSAELGGSARRPRRRRSHCLTRRARPASRFPARVVARQGAGSTTTAGKPDQRLDRTV